MIVLESSITIHTTSARQNTFSLIVLLVWDYAVGFNGFSAARGSWNSISAVLQLLTQSLWYNFFVIHSLWLYRTLNVLHLSNNGESQNCNVESEKTEKHTLMLCFLNIMFVFQQGCRQGTRRMGHRFITGPTHNIHCMSLKREIFVVAVYSLIFIS